jgi:hypothetical protein
MRSGGKGASGAESVAASRVVTMRRRLWAVEHGTKATRSALPRVAASPGRGGKRRSVRGVGDEPREA